MPIIRNVQTIRPTQSEFGKIAYDLMRCVYEIHNEFGRFFDEAVYKRELAVRIPGIELELPVTVTHGTFSKLYKLDVLAYKQGIFEFKAVDCIVARHRAQTINYLLLFDLPHAKVVNIRPERVEDEFVNCHQRLHELRNPPIDASEFEWRTLDGAFFYDQLLAFVHDWGIGLEMSLYEEALTRFLGGEDSVFQPVPVLGRNGHVYDQKMRLLCPGVAFKLTSFPDRLEAFSIHARRLLRHTNLCAIQWANFGPLGITFKTLRHS